MLARPRPDDVVGNIAHQGETAAGREGAVLLDYHCPAAKEVVAQHRFIKRYSSAAGDVQGAATAFGIGAAAHIPFEEDVAEVQQRARLRSQSGPTLAAGKGHFSRANGATGPDQRRAGQVNPVHGQLVQVQRTAGQAGDGGASVNGRCDAMAAAVDGDDGVGGDLQRASLLTIGAERVGHGLRQQACRGQATGRSCRDVLGEGRVVLGEGRAGAEQVDGDEGVGDGLEQAGLFTFAGEGVGYDFSQLS